MLMPARTMRAVDLAFGADAGGDAAACDADGGAVDFEVDDGAAPLVVLEREAPTEWLRTAACMVWAGVATAAAAVSLVASFAWRACAASCMLNAAAFFTEKREREIERERESKIIRDGINNWERYREAADSVADSQH